MFPQVRSYGSFAPTLPQSREIGRNDDPMGVSGMGRVAPQARARILANDDRLVFLLATELGRTLWFRRGQWWTRELGQWTDDPGARDMLIAALAQGYAVTGEVRKEGLWRDTQMRNRNRLLLSRLRDLQRFWTGEVPGALGEIQEPDDLPD